MLNCDEGLELSPPADWGQEGFYSAMAVSKIGLWSLPRLHMIVASAHFEIVDAFYPSVRP